MWSISKDHEATRLVPSEKSGIAQDTSCIDASQPTDFVVQQSLFVAEKLLQYLHAFLTVDAISERFVLTTAKARTTAGLTPRAER